MTYRPRPSLAWPPDQRPPISAIARGPPHTQVEHLRNGFLQPNARLLPAAGVMKGMLVEMRTGEVHGVDLTMVDAYRWSKEVQPIHLEKHKYVQMSEVFDVCAHGARHAANSTRRMAMGMPPKSLTPTHPPNADLRLRFRRC